VIIYVWDETRNLKLEERATNRSLQHQFETSKHGRYSWKETQLVIHYTHICWLYYFSW